MRVAFSLTASLELLEIYRYNAKIRGVVQAGRYEDFLVQAIQSLATDYAKGVRMRDLPDLRRKTFKPRPRGDGHVAVYEVDEADEIVTIVHIFHTKMDVATRIAEDYPPK